MSEQFQVDWTTVLISSLGVIAVRCDGRGNGSQGSEFIHMLDREHQLKALRYKRDKPSSFVCRKSARRTVSHGTHSSKLNIGFAVKFLERSRIFIITYSACWGLF